MCLIFKSTSLRKNSILSTRVRHVPHSKILVQKYRDYLTRLRHVPHLQNNKFKKKSILLIKVRRVPHFQTTNLQKNLIWRMRHEPHFKIISFKYKSCSTRVRHVPYLQITSSKKKSVLLTRLKMCLTLKTHKLFNKAMTYTSPSKS